MSWLYERLFRGEQMDALTALHEQIAAELPPHGTILDLGCGDHTQMACYRTARRKVWGTDVHRHPALQHPDWFRPMDEDRLPFPSTSFDLLTSCWVLEHVARPEHFLAEVARVLRPGGVFISVTMNDAHYVTWITRLFHCLPHRITQRLVERLYGRPEHDTFRTFYRLNSMASLRRHAERSGLLLESVRRIANPHYFRFSRVLEATATTVDWLLERLCPGLGRIYWVVTLRKPAVAEPRRLAA